MIYSCCNDNRTGAVLNSPSLITVDAAGSGYAVDDVLTLLQGSLTGLTVKVTSASSAGGVTTVSLLQSSASYGSGTGIPTQGGQGSGCTLNISGVPNGINYVEVSADQQTLSVNCLNPLPPSTIAALTVDAPGSGYVVGDVLGIPQSGSNQTAAAKVTAISPAGGVTNVSLSQNGINYSTANGVATSGGTGTGCTLNITNPFINDNVMITGGESITGIVAQAVSWSGNVLTVQVNKPGDFSPYTLRLVNSVTQALDAEASGTTDLTQVLTGFDPQLAEVQFSFKVECSPEFDCNPQSPSCSSPLPTPPAINYLAKDYGSFRTLILDRLNQLLPTCSGTSEADLGVVLAELLAYVGDYMSYRQDAITTEAYLETAQSRISLRRHALLVDYHVHDGCNARAWVCFQVSGNAGEAVFLDRALTRLCTTPPATPPNLLDPANEEAALLAGVQFFEPMQDALLYPENGQMNFYTWGDTNCCLPQGSTEATLLGTLPNMHPGDVVIFQENIGPQTGVPADADLRHRCAVRLTQVTTQDAFGNALVDGLFDVNGNPVAISGQPPAAVTEIQWSQDDALPFPLCLSSTYLDSTGQEQSVPNVSVALGNVVLVDHGLTLSTDLGTVPPPSQFYPAQPGADRCQSSPALPLPVRFRPQIPDSPLTQAVPIPVAPLPETSPGAGNPAPSAILPLGGLVGLKNAAGFVCLTLQTTNAMGWPSLLGVLVSANSGNPANIDVSVVYNPPGGAAGLKQQITLEKFTNLSLNASDANYAVSHININSQLIQIQSPTVSTTSTLSSSGPTMLNSTGPVTLILNVGQNVITQVQANNPSGWMQLFGVQVAANANPIYFDLQIFYCPSVVEGVTLPVLVEQFTGLSTSAASEEIDGNSALVIVDSFAQIPDSSLSAYALMNYDPKSAVPSITLAGTTMDQITTNWAPEQNLLDNSESDPAFVVEVESDGTAILRFATPADPAAELQTTNGKVPEQGTSFAATYRIGNGTAGNVGAQSLMLATQNPGIDSVDNPLPAAGGTDPETNDQIRRRAPQAFLSPDRAVTMSDYENMTEANPQIDQAVASLRWTGSWYTVFIAAQPQGGGNLSSTLQAALDQNLELFRLAGQDLEIESPQYVSLEIELQVCVDPNYFQSDVRQGLLSVLGSQILPNGQKGLFYPDNFTFGQTVYLSPVYAAAQSVAGIVSVIATKFQPQGLDTMQYLNAGELKLGTLQIARLENNPNYPDHGQLTLILQGGK